MPRIFTSTSQHFIKKSWGFFLISKSKPIFMIFSSFLFYFFNFKSKLQYLCLNKIRMSSLFNILQNIVCGHLMYQLPYVNNNLCTVPHAVTCQVKIRPILSMCFTAEIRRKCNSKIHNVLKLKMLFSHKKTEEIRNVGFVPRPFCSLSLVV